MPRHVTQFTGVAHGLLVFTIPAVVHDVLWTETA